MPNHCSIEGCTSGYMPTQDRPFHESLATFHFPFTKPELLEKWIKFTGRKDRKPSASSVICEKHSNEDVMNRGKQRVVLKWIWNPLPNILGPLSKKRALTQPTIDSWRKPPKIRNVFPDQLPNFQREDEIPKFEYLEKYSLPGLQVYQSDTTITFYKTYF